MLRKKGLREDEKAMRLLGFTTAPAPSLSGAVRLLCTDADHREAEYAISLNPSQARDLAQALLKLALESEATIFDTP
jgi:hypothetical protein